ncbi:ferredoxin--nitrite reductase [Pseudanabaena sp. Chao 1811]|uniref:ferredoxin--nitrite reductase n=1 Tax=Pseudanabaena sp. Chao 1811 TaxID=2963092 RepID=UPI0022F3AA3E|nr:ferredoxin--nitrite reductase [Pseudanabaena sp. Chao 1811]
MANKIEDLKAAKDGLALKAEIDRFAAIGWEAIDDDDLQHRLKWLGIFFRKSTPGRFMVRMRIPNGLLNSDQMRVLASVVEKCGEHGVADITTRQNIQMRGILIEDVPEMFAKFRSVGLTSVQSAIDNVRNITGSPVAGIDADELYDTRELAMQVQNLLTNNGEGNPAFTNLPRKFNIAIAGCRDNSTHAEINDLAFVPAFREVAKTSPVTPKSEGQRPEWDIPSGFWHIYNQTQGNSSSESTDTTETRFGFNVLVGGFFSAKRVEAAIPLNVWVPPEDVVALCEALLIVYRDHGLRENRAKSRLMFLIDEWGIEKFRAEVEKQLGKPLATAAAKDEIVWEKRDHIGVHPQKQAGLNYVGLQIPVGRMYAPDMYEFARLADTYGNGDIRLTVEQNLLITNVSDQQVPALLQEPLLQKFPANPDNLMRGLVSCTGNQFCPVAIVETKNRSLALTKQLSEDYHLPKVVRIHWSGCPNSCAQPQVADIGFTGCKTRKNGKVVDGVDIYMGGTVGKDAHLGKCVMEKIPCEDLREVVGKLLVEHFGAVPKQQAIAEPSAELVAIG